MRKVTITLPGWIGTEEAQEEVVRTLRAHALLKMEFYRSQMKPFEAKYGTTCSRFQRQVAKNPAPLQWLSDVICASHPRCPPVRLQPVVRPHL